MTHECKTVVYIAGKITGEAGYAAKFADAEMVLQECGYIVLNPTALPLGLDYEDYMAIDFAMIEVADMIVMLRGWQSSPGAQRERDHALASGCIVQEYDNMKKEWGK